MAKNTIISFCDISGEWSVPWVDQGYQVLRVDPQYGQSFTREVLIHCSCEDARLLHYDPKLKGKVLGVMAAPPCTAFTKAAAWKWEGAKKAYPDDRERLLAGLSIVDAIMRAITLYKPTWWCLENPAGRLSRYIGKAQFHFHPKDYAWLADNPAADSWTKQTFLWGQGVNWAGLQNLKRARKSRGKFTDTIQPGPERANQRSKTFQGFARAFELANRPGYRKNELQDVIQALNKMRK